MAAVALTTLLPFAAVQAAIIKRAGRALRIMAFTGLAVLAVFVSCPVQAQDDWPSGSAMAVWKIHTERRDYFAKRLDVRQARLVELVGGKDYRFDHSRLVAAIENQHKAYLAYVAQECEVIGALSGAGGAWPSTYNMGCQARLVERRYHRVTDAIRCIERLPLEGREFNQENCLYQLAQLNMGEWKSERRAPDRSTP